MDNIEHFSNVPILPVYNSPGNTFCAKNLKFKTINI